MKMGKKSPKRSSNKHRPRSRSRSPRFSSHKATDKHKKQRSQRHKDDVSLSPTSSSRFSSGTHFQRPSHLSARKLSDFPKRKPENGSSRRSSGGSPQNSAPSKRQKRNERLKVNDLGSKLCSSLLGFEPDKKEECAELIACVNERGMLVRLAFSHISSDVLQELLPSSLKDFDLKKLFDLAVEELEGLSESRIEAILEGRELSGSSESSDTDVASAAHQIDAKDFGKDQLAELGKIFEKSLPKKTTEVAVADSTTERASESQDGDVVNCLPDQTSISGACSSESVMTKVSVKGSEDPSDIAQDDYLSLEDDYFDAKSETTLEDVAVSSNAG